MGWWSSFDSSIQGDLKGTNQASWVSSIDADQICPWSMFNGYIPNSDSTIFMGGNLLMLVSLFQAVYVVVRLFLAAQHARPPGSCEKGSEWQQALSIFSTAPAIGIQLDAWLRMMENTTSCNWWITLVSKFNIHGDASINRRFYYGY